MQSLAVYVSLIALLLPTAIAQRFSGGDTSGSQFDAPPLEDANLGVYAILILATLVQLGLAAFFLFRARSPHLIPGVAIVVTLVFLLISYALYAALTVDEFTVDDFGRRTVSNQAALGLQIAAFLFANWADLLMVMAVGLVLRDRYLTHSTDSTQTRKPVLPLVFIIAVCILAVLMFIFSTASEGIYGAAFTSFYHRTIGIIALDSQIKTSNGLFYALIATHIIATLFLVGFAVAVKVKVKSDTITSLTLFVIIPLLCLRALARLIFVILNNRLPITNSNEIFALDFSSTFVYGILNLAVAGVLVYCIMSPRLWDGKIGHAQLQYGGFNIGQHPFAQFPGQWGSTGQLMQPGFPAPNVPYQGTNGGHPYAQGANFHPNQQTPAPPDAALTPAEEESSEAVPHPHANLTTPPPTS